MTSPKPEIFVPAGLPLNSTLWSILVAWDFRFICLVIITLSAEMSICYCLFSVGDRYVIDEIILFMVKIISEREFRENLEALFSSRYDAKVFNLFSMFHRVLSINLDCDRKWYALSPEICKAKPSKFVLGRLFEIFKKRWRKSILKH